VSIHRGHHVIDDDGFHFNAGNRRNPDWRTQSIDEWLVELRTYASQIIEAPDDDVYEGETRAAQRARADAQGNAYCLATHFRMLDDWLSSGRRRLPKAWWTTTAAQEPEGGA
jgi:hypothetical protein